MALLFCYYICNFAIRSDFKSLCPPVCLYGLKSITNSETIFIDIKNPGCLNSKVERYVSHMTMKLTVSGFLTYSSCFTVQ